MEEVEDLSDRAATINSSKLQHMKEMLQGLNIEIIGLNETGINIDIDESGKHPLENAKIKAMTYYRASGIPTFSCDSGLYIEITKGFRGFFIRTILSKK